MWYFLLIVFSVVFSILAAMFVWVNTDLEKFPWPSIGGGFLIGLIGSGIKMAVVYAVVGWVCWYVLDRRM